MEKKNPAICLILTAILISTFALVQPAIACHHSDPQDITVQQASYIINHAHNVLILDVRNESEYNLGHLTDAVLIPLHELESRIDELSASQNDKVIVYCAAGSRSGPACQILAENGFTKVYNMLGGITEWVSIGYPIDTTFHAVTLEKLPGEAAQIDVEPLLRQIGCTSCSNGTHPCQGEGEIINIQSTLLEEQENYTLTLVTYEINGTTFEVTIANTILWTYSEYEYNYNKTAEFTLTEITTNETALQHYNLNYMIQHEDYNFTIATNLAPLDAQTYNSSFTVIKYAPINPSENISMELVTFNSSATLSQQYSLLGETAQEIETVYQQSEDESMAQLAEGYSIMAQEAESLSTLVENQLPNYDKTILNIAAILTDDYWTCVSGCYASWCLTNWLVCEPCYAAFCFTCFVAPNPVSCAACAACIGLPVAFCAGCCLVYPAC